MRPPSASAMHSATPASRPQRTRALPVSDA